MPRVQRGAAASTITEALRAAAVHAYGTNVKRRKARTGLMNHRVVVEIARRATVCSAPWIATEENGPRFMAGAWIIEYIRER